MNEKTKRAITITIFVTLTLLLAIGWIFTGRQLNTTREQLTSVTEGLSRAEDLNKQLTEELSRERAIFEDTKRTLTKLSDTTQRSTGTIQDSLRLLRDIKSQVKELEDRFLGWDTGNSTGDNDDNNANNEPLML